MTPYQPPVIDQAEDITADLPRRIDQAFQQHGVVLVRGLVPTLDDFHSVSDRLGRFQPHSAGQFNLGKFGHRYGLTEDGTTTTVNLGQEEIPLHRERAYTPLPPQVMFFYCTRPPESPAPTTALDGCVLLDQLPAELRRFAETTELLYTLDFAVDESLRTLMMRAFGAKDLDQVRALMPVMAGKLLQEDSFELEAFTDERLTYRIRSPQVRRKTRQGRPSFSNTLIRTEEVTLSDGSDPADSPEWRAIDAIARQVQYAHHWQPGDMLVVDNTSAMHGRLAHSDTAREIGVRMGFWAPSFAA